MKHKTVSNIPNYAALDARNILTKNLKLKQRAYYDNLKIQKMLKQE